MLSDPWFYVAAVPAILLVGIGKGGFGAGAMAGVPLLSLVITPAEAAAIMLPVLILMDAVGVGAYRKKFDLKVLMIMAPGAVIGIALGGFAFGLLNADLMRLVIGLLAAGFVLDYLIGGLVPRNRRRPGPALGVLAGLASGFTSTLAHAGGPPSQMYLLPLQLEKTVYVATTVILFALINLTKLVPYALLGLFVPTNLTASLVLAPLAALGTLLGVWLHHRIPPVLFYRLAYGLVGLSGAKLVFDGLAAL
jgi:hypothetical protein